MSWRKRIHSNVSEMAEKIFGDVLSSNGSVVSTYTCSCHCMPSKWRSRGWTGTLRKAWAISILASRVSGPICMTMRAASSTVTYFREARSFAIPSLTHLLGGCERSRMTRHFPGWCFLGITPKRLQWIPKASD